MLSQWRGYANDCNGISIGFDSRLLVHSLTPLAEVRHVIYEVQNQVRILTDTINWCMEFYEENYEKYYWDNVDIDQFLTLIILDFLERNFTLFKDSSFAEENEYRLIVDLGIIPFKELKGNVKFRTNGKRIIPFLPLKHKYYDYLERMKNRMAKDDDSASDPTFATKRLPIVEIIIGANLEFEPTKIGIEMLLEKFGYKDVRVIKSLIPYR